MNETKPERGLASKGIEVYPNYTGSTAKCLNYATQIGDLTKGEREELDATCYDDDVEHSITGIRKKADAFEVTFLYNAKDATSDYRVQRVPRRVNRLFGRRVTVSLLFRRK